MDWTKCIVCQKDKKKELTQCPANSKRKDVGAGYSSFVSNLKAFQELHIEPTPYINVSLLDQGNGIEQTLNDNKAVWHKSCRDIFSNTKLERAKKRKLSEIDLESGVDYNITETTTTSFSPIKPRRSLTDSLVQPEIHCFFCEKSDDATNLHAASMLEVDQKVRECAFLLQDSRLIAKLSAGDLIAIDAKYHAKCLVSLYNRARKLKSSTSKSNELQMTTTDLDELAFAEVIAYIDEFLECEELAVLKLSELAAFYQLKQQELGVHNVKVNATR